VSSKQVQTFFDALASSWDERAEDDLTFVRGLFERIPIEKGNRVLDCACGTGVVTGLLAELSGERVEAIDISPKMIEVAQAKYQNDPRVNFRCVDFLSLGDERYDRIVIYNAYPHFLNPSALCDALYDHLNPGGRFAIVHSLGRARLRAHHAGEAQHISRDLASPNEEWEIFNNNFTRVAAEESESHYLLVGERRLQKAR